MLAHALKLATCCTLSPSLPSLSHSLPSLSLHSAFYRRVSLSATGHASWLCNLSSSNVLFAGPMRSPCPLHLLTAARSCMSIWKLINMGNFYEHARRSCLYQRCCPAPPLPLLARLRALPCLVFSFYLLFMALLVISLLARYNFNSISHFSACPTKVHQFSSFCAF